MGWWWETKVWLDILSLVKRLTIIDKGDAWWMAIHSPKVILQVGNQDGPYIDWSLACECDVEAIHSIKKDRESPYLDSIVHYIRRIYRIVYSTLIASYSYAYREREWIGIHIPFTMPIHDRKSWRTACARARGLAGGCIMDSLRWMVSRGWVDWTSCEEEWARGCDHTWLSLGLDHLTPPPSSDIWMVIYKYLSHRHFRVIDA